jgi:Uma2 family endonuclease
MGIPKKEDKKYYTFEEYLELEALAEGKSEYHGGSVVAMAGGSRNHSLIATNTSTAFNNALDKANKDCMVYSSDVLVKIEQFNKGLYPDITVACEKDETENLNILTNPILLIEVLSKSTKDYDKAAKFEYYRSIPSFKEYVIVYQTCPKIQTWYKEAENLWRIGNFEGLETVVKLHSIGIEIALKDVYKRIKEFSKDEDCSY